MNTLFVKKLTSVDFSFLCPERGLVGETWLVDVFLHGKLNQEGMVFDFGNVKKQMKSLIDGFADHKL
ncbi:MAG: 6-carboxytetrahydropterin synthase, partial [Endozoicomonadaceae bacterium]|nr:6-carboxytetrahydropterin synthase [Endozoicomonadaceae bacterium]